MASTEQSGTLNVNQQLKYLDFVRLAVVQAVSCMLTFYEYLKEGTGPLKSGVDSVEGTVKAVIRPVIQQLQYKPAELLLFVDNKVDATIAVLNKFLPEFVNDACDLAFISAMQVLEAARVAYADMKHQLCSTAQSFYDKYKPVAEEWSSSRWKQVRALPLVPQVVDAVAPPALYGADKMNQLLVALKERNVPLSCCIPLLPVETIKSALRAVDGPNETPVEKTDCAVETSGLETRGHAEVLPLENRCETVPRVESYDEDWDWDCHTKVMELAAAVLFLA